MATSTITLGCSLVDGATGFADAILDSIIVQLNIGLQSMAIRVSARIGELIVQAIDQSPEAKSLRGGPLQGELGIHASVGADPDHVIAAVGQVLADGMDVEVIPVRKVGKGIEGGMLIKVMKQDMSDVLGIFGASFESERGYQIDWLEWLLKRGDEIIIADYMFQNGSFNGRSRTGLGLMVHKGQWRVPPEFSGTTSNNWITRTIVSSESGIERIVLEELKRIV